MSAAASAMALAKAHGIAVSLDGSDLILESRGAIPDEVRLALRKAKGDLVAALRREVSGAVAGDDLLDALRRKGFVIQRYGQDDGTMPPLPDVVAKHAAFFRRLLAWQAPDQKRGDGAAVSRGEAVSDIYPAKDQREALLELVRALGCRANALRRDDCGDWRIEGRSGHVYAICGTLERPDAPGFQIYVAGSGRWWAAAKRALAPFASLTSDGEDEGMLFLDRLPTPVEAEVIRHFVGIAKKRIVSDAERERLASYGHRFEKRSEAGGDIRAEKTASDEMSAPTAPPVVERAS